MKKDYSIVISAFLCCFLLLCIPMTVFANSSWHWLTSNPLPMLHWAIAGTLIVEVIIIYPINHIKNKAKPAVVVFIGNIVSFLTPLMFIGITPVIFEENENFFSRISRMADKLPFYLIGFAFLLLTLIVEIPIVYFSLAGNVNNKKRLIASIIVANTITTIAVGLIERMIYRGSW